MNGQLAFPIPLRCTFAPISIMRRAILPQLSAQFLTRFARRFAD
jgi:hypothetical protein